VTHIVGLISKVIVKPSISSHSSIFGVIHIDVAVVGLNIETFPIELDRTCMWRSMVGKESRTPELDEDRQHILVQTSGWAVFEHMPLYHKVFHVSERERERVLANSVRYYAHCLLVVVL